MDVRLESLIAGGATYKSYIRKDMAKVSIKLSNGTEYSGNGRNEEVAIERLLSSVESGAKDIKHQRRRKERERKALLEEAYDELDFNYGADIDL